jgi:hypothetical protein
MSTPRVRHILETSVYCDDLGRTAGFYKQLLDSVPMLETERLVALDAGAGTVLLLFQRGRSSQSLQTSEGSARPRRQRSVALRIRDRCRRVAGVGKPAGCARYSDRESRRMGAWREERVLSRSRRTIRRARHAWYLANLLIRIHTLSVRCTDFSPRRLEAHEDPRHPWVLRVLRVFVVSENP